VRNILEDIDLSGPAYHLPGVASVWWARSAPSLGTELSLNPERVQEVFDRYPMIFRKSLYIEESKAHSYALQMRYARRKDGDIDHPPKVSHFPVLSEAQVISLIDFLVRISSLENTVGASQRGMYVAVLAAIVSAATAIAVAILKGGAS
jgi:hypothetical protein